MSQSSMQLLTAPQIAGLLPAPKMRPVQPEQVICSDKVMYMPSRIAMPDRDFDPVFEYNDARWNQIEAAVRQDALNAVEKFLDMAGIFLRGDCNEALLSSAGRDLIERVQAARRKGRKEAKVATAEILPPPAKTSPAINRTPALAELNQQMNDHLEKEKTNRLMVQSEQLLDAAGRLKTLLKEWLNIDAEPKSHIYIQGSWTYTLTGNLNARVSAVRGMLSEGLVICRADPHGRRSRMLRSNTLITAQTAQDWVKWADAEVKGEHEIAEKIKMQYFPANSATARKVTGTAYKTLEEMNAETAAFFTQGAAKLNNLKNKYAGV